MRNLKKLLAVVVAICVLATMAIPAFAVETAPSAAKTCEDLGVLKGDGAGVNDDYLAKGTSRLQAATLYLRLLGLEDEALAETSTDNFADAKTVYAGGQKILAYLKAHPELGWNGVGGDKFDPNGAASAQMMYKVMLEAMGFKMGTDFQWADTITFSADKGLSKIADVTKMTNGDMATAIVEALNAKVKGADTTLAAKLVADGVITSAAAEAAGLVASAVALDVSGAIALNSKVVEVSLGTAAAAKDLAAATFAVKDSAGKELAVASAEFAPWSTDNKSVIVTLSADTTAGTLYTLTVGAKSVNFGGKAADTSKPTATVKSTDYNEVTVTFSEAIKLETAKVTIKKSYGDVAVLETSSVKYNGSSKLVFATADQADATLYNVVVEDTTDLAGNKMDKAELTFVGQSKPTADQSVVAAKALDYKTIYVEFGVNVDPATVAVENFKLVDVYASATEIAIADAKMATTTQAGKYNTSYTDDQKTAAIKKGVVLTLTGEVKDATLYKLTASNVKTLYGKALSSTEAKTYTTFAGKSKPGADSLTYTAKATSNTNVELTFANDLDKVTAENIANYAIVKAYGDAAKIEVTKAVVKDDRKVNLTVAAMAIDMYKVTATGIKDIYGNSIKTSSDANIQSFAGKSVAAKISSMTISDLTDGKGKIRVTFNQNYGDGALDVASYSLDNSIGYPSKAEKVSGNDAAIDLTIPNTEIGKLYTLTVKGVKNSDGVAMDTNGIKNTFVGNDDAAGATKLEAAYALDAKTIKLFFNKNVEDISGIDRTSATTLAGEIVIADGASAVTVSHAFVDPANKKVIIAYATAGNFKDGGSDDSFTAKVEGAGLDADNDTKSFAENTSDPAKIKVNGIVAKNSKTLEILFNQPVRFLANGFAYVENGDADFTITNLRASNDDKTLWEASISGVMENKQYTLKLAAIDNTLISNIATGVTLNVLDDTRDYSFAGNGTEALYVKDIYAVGANKRTIKVYYPEAMNETDVKNTAYYTVVNSAGTDLNSSVIVLAEYDAATKVATLTTNADFTASTTGYFLKINTAVKNALGTKIVKTDATTDFKKEFALGTADAAKVTIKEVTVSGQDITIKLNQRAKTASTATTTNAAAEFVIKVNDTDTAIVTGDIASVASYLGDATVADTRVGFFDKIVIKLTPALTTNKAGKVDFVSGADLKGINNEADDADQSEVVFVQK